MKQNLIYFLLAFLWLFFSPLIAIAGTTQEVRIWPGIDLSGLIYLHKQEASSQQVNTAKPMPMPPLAIQSIRILMCGCAQLR
jgi:hypothetical protein